MEKIYEAIIDPKWNWGKLNIDGKELYFIKLVHPKHGDIVSIVPKDVLITFRKGINELIGA